MFEVSKYTKAIVSIIAAVAIALSTALSDNALGSVEIVTVALAFITAVSVYLVPNLDGSVSRYAKGIVAFAGAALTTLSTILIDVGTVSTTDILTIIITGLGAIGVVALPNKNSTKVGDVDDSDPIEEVDLTI